MDLLKAWHDLLKERASGDCMLIGGDVEHVDPAKGMFRGPIKGIRIEGETLVIVKEWTARALLNRQGVPRSGWEKVTQPDADIARYNIAQDIMSPPEDMDRGCIYFDYQSARVTLFPQGDSKLSPLHVRGL